MQKIIKIFILVFKKSKFTINCKLDIKRYKDIKV